MEYDYLAEAIAKLTKKRSIFVSYHHDNDQAYYEQFSWKFGDTYEVIRDNSLNRLIDSDDSEYVMQRIRDKHISGTSCTIVLCGRETPLRKYVDWEIKATLDKEHGLVAIGLPTIQSNYLGQLYVPARLCDNLYSGYAVWLDWPNLNIHNLKEGIEHANSKPSRLINNSRLMRRRNG